MLDLVALRESLSYSSVITHTTCNPDDCQPIATNTEEDEEEEKKECAYLSTSLCGRRALDLYYEVNTENKVAKCG